jgi:alpha/beta superfamily hydrolase
MPVAPLREIPGPVGPLEALLAEAVGAPRAACVFAHPHPLYGGTMHTRAVYQATKALARIGVTTLRFNFRGVGRSSGTHDGGPGEMDDYRAALDFMAAYQAGLPLYAAGFSFGSWVAWNVGLDDPRVGLMLGLGLPVNLFDFSPVTRSDKAKFLVHGELDEVVPVRDIRKFYGELGEPKELSIIPGADHLFDGHTTELEEAVADLLRDWTGMTP